MTQSPEKYFDSELVTRLSRMELSAQRIVDGFLSGKNRSSRHGLSVEFVEHREYAPGDDLRHLDWKVLARMDRYYIKRYEEETNITVILMVDCSASMSYASEKISKFEMGATAASAIGYMLNKQRDAVGLVLFDDELREFVPPSVKWSGLANIVSKLQGTETRGKSNLIPILQRLLPELPGRCLFVWVSDLFLPGAEVNSGLKMLHYHGHDCVVLHTLDEAERSFPFRQNMQFRGLEDDRRLLAEPQRLRTEYLAALEVFLDSVRKSCEQCAFDYQLLSTGEPLAPVLTTLMAARARKKRVTNRGRG